MAKRDRDTETSPADPVLTLLGSSDVAEWRLFAPPCPQYDAAVRAKIASWKRRPMADFAALDAKVRACDARLAADKPTQVHAAVVDIVLWKLMRGQFRPGLLEQVRKNDPAAVQAAVAASTTVLRALVAENAPTTPAGIVACWMRAVGAMSVLKGVGPATASAVLARLPAALFAPAAAPLLPPFFEDVAAMAVLGKRTLAYSTAELSEFFTAVLKKSQVDLHGEISLVCISDALWARSLAPEAAETTE